MNIYDTDEVKVLCKMIKYKTNLPKRCQKVTFGDSLPLISSFS